MDKEHKIHVNYRITERDKKIIEWLAKQLGVSETDVIKLSIRDLLEKKLNELQTNSQQARVEDLSKRRIHNIKMGKEQS